MYYVYAHRRRENKLTRNSWLWVLGSAKDIVDEAKRRQRPKRKMEELLSASIDDR